MTHDFSKPPYSFFAPPGAVDVSGPALETARKFLQEAKARKPGRDWALTFEWADSRFIRHTLQGPRTDLGPGLDIVVFERAEIPVGVTQTKEGLDFVVKIPSNIYERARLKLIDVDTASNSKVVLR